MVCPYRHIADYTETSDEEAAEIADLTRDAMRLVRAVSGAQGFNVGMNQGDVAGAGISAHLHQHVVPRWPGDQNFMPIIGRTKTLPELLGETRTLLAGPGRPRAMSGLDDDAALAGELVRAAGRLARRMRAAGLDTEQKTSVSDLVTAADKAAERLIVERLRAERPDDAIVGEEGTDQPGTSGRAWVIDPVDGTYNFVAGLPWWCSALALTDDDDARARRGPPPRDGHALRGRPGPALDPGRRAAAAARRTGRWVRCARPRTCTTRAPTAADPGGVRPGGRPAPRPCGCWAPGTMDAMAIAEGQLGVSFQHSVPDWDRLPGAAIIRGAGGVARQVEAAGVTWSVAGAPTAVDDVCDALGEGCLSRAAG